MLFSSFHSSGDGSQDATGDILINIVKDAEVVGREMLGDLGGRRWTELLSAKPDGQSYRMLKEDLGIESRFALAETITNVAYVDARMAMVAGAGSAYTTALGRGAEVQLLGGSVHGEGARPTNSELGSFVELGSSVSGCGALDRDVLNARAHANHGVGAEHEGRIAQSELLSALPDWQSCRELRVDLSIVADILGRERRGTDVQTWGIDVQTGGIKARGCAQADSSSTRAQGCAQADSHSTRAQGCAQAAAESSSSGSQGCAQADSNITEARGYAQVDSSSSAEVQGSAQTEWDVGRAVVAIYSG
jgi:hypothetical protein